jgi:putative ABC transport system substrate-binding protein
LCVFYFRLPLASARLRKPGVVLGRMQRREFITLLGGAAVAWPRAARAQQPVQEPGIHLVGFLSGTTREGFEPNAAALREGLKEVGFFEGRNLAIEYRVADDHYDRLSALAADLIEHHVALIAADPRGVYAAQKVTKTVPIVFMSGADPVKNGLVAILPGGDAAITPCAKSVAQVPVIGYFNSGAA